MRAYMCRWGVTKFVDLIITPACDSPRVVGGIRKNNIRALRCHFGSSPNCIREYIFLFTLLGRRDHQRVLQLNSAGVKLGRSTRAAVCTIAHIAVARFASHDTRQQGQEPVTWRIPPPLSTFILTAAVNLAYMRAYGQFMRVVSSTPMC